jgi:long-subunit fatty acid transport protein
MKTFLSTTIISILSINALSQSNGYYGFEETAELSTGWNFYANNYLSGPSAGKGNTGVASLSNGVSSIAINPATFNVEKRFAFCFQSNYKFNLTIDNPLLYPPDRYNNALPSAYFALGYKFAKNIQAGLFYSNPSSLKNIPGESGELTREFSIHTMGIPISLSFKDVNFGVSLEYSFYKSTISGLTQITNPDGTYVKANGFNFRFGFIYKPSGNFSIGVSALPGVSLNVNSTLPHISLEYYGLPQFPWKISAGMEYRITTVPLKFSFDYNFVKGPGIDYYSRDVNNINFGAEYTLSKKITLRSGFFTSNSPDYSNYYDQFFITAGCGIKLNNFNIDAAILHSHFPSDAITTGNTILQTSVAYSF